MKKSKSATLKLTQMIAIGLLLTAIQTTCEMKFYDPREGYTDSISMGIKTLLPESCDPQKSFISFWLRDRDSKTEMFHTGITDMQGLGLYSTRYLGNNYEWGGPYKCSGIRTDNFVEVQAMTWVKFVIVVDYDVTTMNGTRKIYQGRLGTDSQGNGDGSNTLFYNCIDRNYLGQGNYTYYVINASNCQISGLFGLSISKSNWEAMKDNINTISPDYLPYIAPPKFQDIIRFYGLDYKTATFLEAYSTNKNILLEGQGINVAKFGNTERYKSPIESKWLFDDSSSPAKSSIYFFNIWRYAQADPLNFADTTFKYYHDSVSGRTLLFTLVLKYKTEVVPSEKEVYELFMDSNEYISGAAIGPSTPMRFKTGLNINVYLIIKITTSTGVIGTVNCNQNCRSNIYSFVEVIVREIRSGSEVGKMIWYTKADVQNSARLEDSLSMEMESRINGDYMKIGVRFIDINYFEGGISLNYLTGFASLPFSSTNPSTNCLLSEATKLSCLHCYPFETFFDQKTSKCKSCEIADCTFCVDAENCGLCDTSQTFQNDIFHRGQCLIGLDQNCPNQKGNHIQLSSQGEYLACLTCPKNCLVCFESESWCNRCSNYSYAPEGLTVCTCNINNCDECLYSSCDKCNSGFIKQISKNLDVNCISSTNIQSGYILHTNTSKTSLDNFYFEGKCYIGYILDGTNSRCVSCAENDVGGCNQTPPTKVLDENQYYKLSSPSSSTPPIFTVEVVIDTTLFDWTGCLSVNADNECLTCKTGFVQSWNYYGRKGCGCPLGSMLDSTTKTCSKCSMNCLYCDNYGCQACMEHSKLILDASGSKVCECDNLYRADLSMNKCVRCKDTCNNLLIIIGKNCNENECLRCVDNSKFIDINSSPEVCRADCSMEYIIEITYSNIYQTNIQRCMPCDSSLHFELRDNIDGVQECLCKTPTTADETHYFKTIDSLGSQYCKVVDSPNLISLDGKQSLDSCSSKTGTEGSTIRVCKKCTISNCIFDANLIGEVCETSSIVCDKCLTSPPHYLYQTSSPESCVSNIPAGYGLIIGSPITRGNVLESCRVTGCRLCNINSNTCSSCNTGLYLSADFLFCTTACLSGQGKTTSNSCGYCIDSNCKKSQIKL